MRKMGWMLFVFSASCLWASDPCGPAAREGVMGQTTAQLLKAISLSDDQEMELLKIHQILEQQGRALYQEAETARQQFFDGFLSAAEDGDLSSEEGEHLTKLLDTRGEKRQVLLEFYAKRLDEAAALLTGEQTDVLNHFRAGVKVSEISARAGEKLIKTWRKVRDSFQNEGVAQSEDIEKFKAAMDEARGVVYIPFWLENTLDMMLLDYDAYRDEFLVATRRFRVMGKSERIHVNHILDLGVNLLVRAAKPQSFDDASAAHFHLGLLISPLGACLLE